MLTLTSRGGPSGQAALEGRLTGPGGRLGLEGPRGRSGWQTGPQALAVGSLARSLLDRDGGIRCWLAGRPNGELWGRGVGAAERSWERPRAARGGGLAGAEAGEAEVTRGHGGSA